MWVGYYDALDRLGLAVYPQEETEHLGQWAALARSCGWWWPGEQMCVVVQRPETIDVGPAPGARHEESGLAPTGCATATGGSRF